MSWCFDTLLDSFGHVLVSNFNLHYATSLTQTLLYRSEESERAQSQEFVDTRNTALAE